ncbi:MAG: hypothetical protein JNK72_16130 [Myxococcales bacterium]|nr:hypothetical protein [Myxococcales bacterium]
MALEHHCENCGFDLSKLEQTILYARKGGEARKLHCPICRSDRVKIAALERVFSRAASGRWVRWREGGGAGGASNTITLGRLKLRVEGEIEPLSKEQICFRMVPVFVSEGRLTWPALPVMPEYLDCLDPAQVRLAREKPELFGRVIQERGKSRYQCVLPLRGLKSTEWPTYECEILPANPFAVNAGDAEAMAFRGVSVKVWPNLRRPTHAWRYYLVQAGANSEEGMNLFAQGRHFRAQMLVAPSDADGRPASETLLERIALDQEVGREGESNPTGYVGASRRGRPAWVSVEFYQPVQGGKAEALGGGLLPLRPAIDATSNDTWNLGIDFGTSNTVIAVKRKDGTIQCVAPERGRERASTTLSLIDGGPQTLQRGLDLWPGGEWSGPFRDLLPSELACHKRWIDLASDTVIGNLAFGKDFGVPLRGGVGAVGSDHVVSEFKWLRAVEKDKTALAQRNVVQELQARFLEGAMLMTAASQLAEEEAAPRSVNVSYSFPLAFDEGDLDTLKGAAQAAGERLKALTGADFLFAPPLVDEAQAAAGHTPSDKMFRVYCDLGGGSLEVLVDDTLARNSQQGHSGMHPHVFSSSIFFGGSVYLRSLLGAGEHDRKGSCLMPAMSSYTRLASAVRQSPSGKALLESPHVIAETRKATAERRARVYIGYIVEWVARMLAGVCLEHGRTVDGRLDLSRNRLFTLAGSGAARRWILGANKGPGQKRVVEFSLVLLGNGWGFGDIVRDGMKNVEQMMAQRVYARLSELLRENEALCQQISDGDMHLLDPRLTLDVSFVLPPEGTHRKAAVALGLLGTHHATEDAARFFKKRSVERHGVMGFDLWLNDGSRKIPWYRPFGPPAEDDPSQYDRIQEVQAGAGAAPPQGFPQPQPKAPQGGGGFPIAQPGSAPYAAPVQPAAMPGAMPMMPGAMPGAMPTMPGAMPMMPGAMYGAPAMMPGAMMPGAMPMMGFAMSPEMLVMQLQQQWMQLSMLAAQSGSTPLDYAKPQLWQQLSVLAQQQGLTVERMLAQQQWQRLVQPLMMTPGLGPEQMQLAQHQQMQAVTAAATQRGQSAETFLAQQRWEGLLAMLQPAPMAPMMPFPFDPNAR